MTKLKCPFCQQEMVIPKEKVRKGIQCCVCRNPKCEFDGWHFPVKIINILINTKELLDIEDAEHSMCHTQMLKTTEKLERTKKKLDDLSDKNEKLKYKFDRTIWWLKEIVENHRFTPISTAEKALEELTKGKTNDR